MENTEKDFMTDTVHYIVDYLKSDEHNCYLLADETGLGKTIEAREVIHEMAKDREKFHVLYIASNQDLAKNNIKKLIHKKLEGRTILLNDKNDIKDINGKTKAIKTDRFSLIPKLSDDLENIKNIIYLAVTPKVSLYLEGDGNKEEKDEYFETLYNDINDSSDYANKKYNKEDYPAAIFDKIDKIENYKKELCNKIDEIDGNTNCSYKKYISKLEEFLKIDIKITGVDVEEDRKVIFDAIWANMIDKVRKSENINECQYKDVFEDLLPRIGQYLFDGLYSYYSKEICEEENLETLYAFTFYERFSDYIYFINNMVDKDNKKTFDKLFIEDVYDCKRILDIKKEEINKNELKEGKDIQAYKIEKIKDDYKYIYKYYLDLIDSFDVYFELKKQFENKEKSFIYATKECFGVFSRELHDYELEDELFVYVTSRILIDYYNNLIMLEKRLLATLVGIKVFAPDLVILDEFQNYPKIFKDIKSDENEDTHVLEMILEKAIGKKSNNTSRVADTKTKVLMLSATPYSYQNMILKESESDQGDDIDEDKDYFSHIGVENIISYMSERNGVDVNFKELYSNYRDSIHGIMQKEDVNDVDRDSIIQCVKKPANELSQILLSLGVSRNERPASDFIHTAFNKREKWNCYINPSEGGIDISAEEILVKIEGESKNAKDVRRFLSMPVYYSGNESDNNDDLLSGKFNKNGYNIRSRMKHLLKDIFPSDDFIPPIFLPAVKHRELKGYFADYDYGEKYEHYSKKILFSAYTSVPKLICDFVNERFQKIIESSDYSSDIVNNSSSDKFKEYIKNIFLCGNDEKGMRSSVLFKYDYFNKDKYIDEDEYRKYIDSIVESIAYSIVNIFKTDYAGKIIFKVFEKIYKEQCNDKVTEDNYWCIVKQYCKDGDFYNVLDEFVYLYYEENKNNGEKLLEDFQKYMENISGKLDFSTCYTSKPVTHKNFESYINGFQSPFYPMNFFLSSVAQEGLDFHWYCDFIVHWNVPVSPIAFIQREGRVNRYHCYSLRKKIYKEFLEDLTNEKNNFRDDSKDGLNEITWEKIFEEAREFKSKLVRSNNEKYAFLYPDHLSADCQPLPIQRRCYYYPLSEEHFRWIDLMKNMQLYRSLLGAWSIPELEEDETLKNSLGDVLKDCVIDLSPPVKDEEDGLQDI